MAEQLTQPKSPESNGSQEIAEAAGERLKSLEESNERYDEKSQEKTIEKARKQVEQETIFAKEQSTESHANSEPSTVTTITVQQKQREYNKTIKEMHTQLSKPSKTFSKVIHNPAVEKISDTAGATIVRPNAILAGSITAFLVVLALYSAAKYFGFRLSGFELIGAFALGWLLGIAFDVLRVIFIRRRAL